MMAPDKSKKTLFDSDDELDGGVQLKVNDEYARRFEHNKKREEQHRLEEKYQGRQSQKTGGKDNDDDDDDESDSSDDETEDEEGVLATEELDAQLNATLQAIRNKDPRIYDPNAQFYAPIDDEADDDEPPMKSKKEKTITLKDYHRERIMRGDAGVEDDDDDNQPARTYAQEQDDLKKTIRDEIQAQLRANTSDAGSDDEDEGFLKAKEGAMAKATAELSQIGMHPSRAAKVKPKKVSLEEADKNPELYLSNFMESRAWIEEDAGRWKAFESDEEDDEKAEKWEAAYNLRFEDPEKSNEILKTYARDVAAAKSVRREEKTGRKKQRELERERKEAEKQQRKEERARLRRLKIDDAERKLKQIKKVAGLSGKTIKDEEWIKFLDDAWDNDKWEEEMRKTFGDEYYAEQGDVEVSEDEDQDGKKKKKVKKPKFKDDIDINDIIPGFEEEEKPKVSLSELEADAEEDEDAKDDEDEDGHSAKRQKTTKDRRKERLASQKEVRQVRSKIEALVDAKLDIDEPDILKAAKAKDGPKFAYRETWKESFGLTAQDILMAPSDAALNEYAGLKKLAHFRPDDKKSKDKKRLGKKARLRQWRRETFGPEAEREGPQFIFGGAPEEKEEPKVVSNIIEGKKKRKRSGRKGKKVDSEE
ncbi:KRI1-like family C-terminal-domain-containing protein [Pseudomassariella vexata]|uniref:KRI1-like family C-terminal-domain-containing protein n=1 Tax=Pseudomassariella vexata TaxID=1141098 RepID=A0A1Y2EE80_9PEZI|nr:KRI1-like family C-terminal-domain-containing protein [Pseudomassariella vexata]ORY69879.1 KRI1-like family C-terminal-domain-containing protein [Pseudomassariella vexata]